MIDLSTQSSLFLEKLQNEGKSFNTIKNYKTDLNCFNDFILKSKNSYFLEEFTFDQVKEYTTYIEEKYPSVNSRRRRIQALRLFFDYLITQGKFSDNPIRKINVSPKFVDIPRPPKMAEIFQFLTFLNEKIKGAKDLERLILTRNKLIFYLVYSAGLKVSEIEGLKRADILFSNEDETYRILVKHTKRDPLTIPLPSSFKDIYIDYSEQLEASKLTSNIEFDFLFFNANPFKILSGNLSARGAEIIFKEISDSLQIKITPKSLRQACVFRWIREGIKPQTIKDWMGVLPSYSLKRYTDLFEEQQKGEFNYIGLEELDK
jgi:site-specific recombinase XerD